MSLKNRFVMDLVNFIFLDKLLKLSVRTGLLQSSVSILYKLFLSFTSVVYILSKFVQVGGHQAMLQPGVCWWSGLDGWVLLQGVQ